MCNVAASALFLVGLDGTCNTRACTWPAQLLLEGFFVLSGSRLQWSFVALCAQSNHSRFIFYFSEQVFYFSAPECVMHAPLECLPFFYCGVVLRRAVKSDFLLF